MPYDVIIVGGGPAGLSAALVLGRMRRSVLVLDANRPANAVEHAVGGMLTRDGTPPAELRAIAREEVGAYPSVELRDAEVGAVRAADRSFEVEAGDETLAARKLILAHGLDYELPTLPGIAGIWGEAAFHCPYCHGWEVRGEPLVVVATSPRAPHQALLLRSISDSIRFVRNGVDCDSGALASLERAGVEVEEELLERVEADPGGVRVDLAQREPLFAKALFIQTELRVACDFAVELGARLDDAGSVAVDASGGTGVHGLRVAGDAGAPPQSVAVAIGEGATAAYATNAELALEPFEPTLPE